MLRLLKTLTASAALAAVATISSAQTADDVVRIGVWGGSPGTMFRELLGAAFTEKTGIPVEVYEMPSAGAAIVAAEGETDFNVGVITGFEVAQLSQRGLLKEFTYDQLPSMRDFPEEVQPLTEDGERLFGVPSYYIFYGIARNTDFTSEEDFASWQSLVDPKWKGRISVTRPVFMSVYDLTLYAYLNGGDETNIEPGIPFLRQVIENALTVYPSMGTFNSMIAQGEIIAGPYYSSVNFLKVKDDSTNFRVELPEEGGLLLPYAVVQPAGTPESPAAEAFLEFVASPEAQSLVAQYTYMPMNPKATIPPEFEEFLGMSAEELLDKLYKPDWNVIADAQEERVRLVEQIIGEMGL
ncbi:PotD/PotF family extracellular solute-binding protein [Rhodosalinus sp. FB01]|uniref:ABC transporter substrate-binding protein n=1 Tax=Rhodosalinus sp. FB01 TaxID=3239194 RepID=UPI003525E1E3